MDSRVTDGSTVSIIAAVAKNGVIGRNGEIPWHLKSDLKRFRQITMGHAVIVGRRTHEVILRRLGHPLENRRTIVVTRNLRYQSECEVTHTLEAALERVRNNQEVFIIGGAELYREALPLARRIYLTHVQTEIEGDAFFPDFPPGEWEEIERSVHPDEPDDDHASYFVIYQRRPVPFVNLGNARFDDQLAVMEQIARESICPFCPEHRTAGEILDPVWQGKHWTLAPNRWPYKFTTLHLMAIPERHVEFEDELSPEEVLERTELLRWVKKYHGLAAYSTGARSGNPQVTGATVRHFHFHIVVADPDVTKPGYERVRFAMGPKPSEK